MYGNNWLPFSLLQNWWYSIVFRRTTLQRPFSKSWRSPKNGIFSIFVKENGAANPRAHVAIMHSCNQGWLWRIQENSTPIKLLPYAKDTTRNYPCMLAKIWYPMSLPRECLVCGNIKTIGIPRAVCDFCRWLRTRCVMVFGERVARSVVASIVGAILASQYCASQMTGNLIYTQYTIMHAVSSIVAHVHV